ncbi:MAG TPA: zinc metalloprotease HtpX [Longimicrobiales bacterium]|nr:zinc metalloprotease HtpX [Longimicrobiales bacterium]
MQTTKVLLMMAALTALLVVAGGAVGGREGAIIAFAFAALTNFAMYWWSDKLVLRMYRARVVGPEEAPGLYQVVDRLRQNAGLPMPTVAIAPSKQPNAFATGRGHDHAVVCVTEGILELIDKDEMEAVIAHELAHVKHRHMLVGTIAATMAGAIGFLASMARWGAIFGGRNGDRNPIALLVAALVAPIAAMIIQFAVSRQNEYQADRTGALICGQPLSLADALRKLDAHAHRIPMEVNPAAAQLAIVNPLAALKGGGMMSLFSTHPPTEERVKRLVALRDDPEFRSLGA